MDYELVRIGKVDIKDKYNKGNRMGFLGRKNIVSLFWFNFFNVIDEEIRGGGGVKWFIWKLGSF